MDELQRHGAQLLVPKAQFPRQRLGRRCAVLGIAQDGTARMGAVDPELVGPAGDRFQLQKGAAVLPLQDLKPGYGMLAVCPDLPQQALSAPAGQFTF